MMIIPILILLPSWVFETGPLIWRALSLVLLAASAVIFCLRFTVHHRLRIGPDGVELISWLGRRRLQFSEIERFKIDRVHHAKYTASEDDMVAGMTVETYRGIAIRARGGKDIFIAASPEDADTALSAFLDIAPLDNIAVVTGAEAAEEDRRDLQAMARRTSKGVRTMTALNAVIAAALFLLVVYLTFQLLPDVDASGRPESFQSKLLFGSLLGLLLLGMDLFFFAYYYGNHVELQATRLRDRLDLFNSRTRGMPLALELNWLFNFRSYVLRTLLIGALIIGISMAAPALMSIWVPGTDAGAAAALGICGAALIGISAVFLFKM